MGVWYGMVWYGMVWYGWYGWFTITAPPHRNSTTVHSQKQSYPPSSATHSYIQDTTMHHPHIIIQPTTLTHTPHTQIHHHHSSSHNNPIMLPLHFPPAININTTKNRNNCITTL